MLPPPMPSGTLSRIDVSNGCFHVAKGESIGELALTLRDSGSYIILRECGTGIGGGVLYRFANMPNKCSGQWQLVEGVGLIALSREHPEASYMDKNENTRILCGSI